MYNLKQNPPTSSLEAKTPAQKQAQELQRQRMENNLRLSERISEAQRQWGQLKQPA